MTITMDDTQITTLEQVRAVLESPEGLAFNRSGREELYIWIDSGGVPKAVEIVVAFG
jgi:hypothetical protein